MRFALYFVFILINTPQTGRYFKMVDILYQDPWFIAINKPSGLLVHRSALDPHATAFAVQQVRETTGKHVFPVHRLDRPTSGVLLFSFSSHDVTLMQSVWNTQVVKKYHALVRGWVHGCGYIDYHLKYKADKLAEANKSSNLIQPATTTYTCLEVFQAPIKSKRYEFARYSLLELFLHTGRKHQLRRHLAHLRHPIIGDTTHGDGEQNTLARLHLNCKHLLLSCVELCFVHPKTHTPIVIKSPKSDNFQHCLHVLATHQ